MMGDFYFLLKVSLDEHVIYYNQREAGRWYFKQRENTMVLQLGPPLF